MQLDQALGDAFGLLAIGAGAENDLKIGHRLSSCPILALGERE
jgi:hypothetical protein